ncbi:MAG: tetratricopeptide repeat protein [Desulfobacterales bacterium]|nr:tetratricopeptide repeat protein [Desulfobacterales bacterium]
MKVKTAFLNIRPNYLICLFLVLIILAVYGQVRKFEFVNYDDDAFVYDNSFVQAGLTSDSIIWAFTTTATCAWQPLVWLSYMADCQLWQVNPGRLHMTNVLFHIANALLLFLVFRKMTGNLWQSSFVAALFAVHPLHVEAVAWISQRKDVLSTLFWILTIWGYARYVEKPGIIRYLVPLLFFIMGLMAKPMLVTLPFVLFLLDYWPLGRLSIVDCRLSIVDCRLKRLPIVNPQSSILNSQSSILNPQSSIFLEKIPFFILAAISSAIAIFAHHSVRGLASMKAYPLYIRIWNALISYAAYIGKMIWPHNLMAFYPYRRIMPIWAAILILGIISVMAVISFRKHPYFIVGWLWFMGTLVPVIGLFKFGSHAMADRYTYVPYMGLYIIIAWTVPGILSRLGQKRVVLSLVSAVYLSALMITAWTHTGYWANSITLFQHAIDVDPDNYRGHNNLAVALDEKGRKNEAAFHYSEAIRIKPEHYTARNNLGLIMAAQGRAEEAVSHYSVILSLYPHDLSVLNNLAMVLAGQGKIDEAVRHLTDALRTSPNDANTLNNMGVALFKQGKNNEAIICFQKALKINPDFAFANNNLKKTLAIQKQYNASELQPSSE